MGNKKLKHRFRVEQLHTKQHGICGLCGTVIEDGDIFSWEHLTPKHKGGRNTKLQNLVVTHATCNQSKGRMTLEEAFRRKRDVFYKHYMYRLSKVDSLPIPNFYGKDIPVVPRANKKREKKNNKFKIDMKLAKTLANCLISRDWKSSRTIKRFRG